MKLAITVTIFFSASIGLATGFTPSEFSAFSESNRFGSTSNATYAVEGDSFSIFPVGMTTRGDVSYGAAANAETRYSFDTNIATLTSPATQPYGYLWRLIHARVKSQSSSNVSYQITQYNDLLVDALDRVMTSGRFGMTLEGTATSDYQNITFWTVDKFESSFYGPFFAEYANMACGDIFYMGANTQDVVFDVVSIESRFYRDVPPVPEPASMAALGLGALALLRRKRSK